jgi:hypothetical protein
MSAWVDPFDGVTAKGGNEVNEVALSRRLGVAIGVAMLLAALVVAILALGGVASAQREGPTASDSATAQRSTVEDGRIEAQAVPVPGSWRLFFDWGCDGSYSTLAMTVNSNGTWTSTGFSGPWVQEAGMFMFTFNGAETTYAGNLASKSITGISTTFAGLRGCFHMLQAGVPTTVAAEREADQRDAAGRK